MMSVQTVFVVLAFAYVFTCNSAQEIRKMDEPCRINNEDVYWLSGMNGVSGNIINDTYKGELMTMTTSGIADFKVDSEDSKWLSFNYNSTANTLSVATKDEFKNYEDEAVSKRIEVPMQIKCKNGEKYNVTYYQTINDINTYEPVWSKKEYVIEIYGSLQENVYLSSFVDISVTDKDCSPDTVSFYLEHDGNKETEKEISIGRSHMEGKATKVMLVTRTSIPAPFKATYIMKAKDRSLGDDNKETTAKLTIHLLDSEMKFAFTKNEYSIKVVKNKVVWENTDPIEMTEGLDHDVEVELVETEYSKYFSVQIDHLTGGIRLQLEEPLPKPSTNPTNRYFSSKDFTLTLMATWQTRNVTTSIKVSTDDDINVVCFVPAMNINANYYDNPIVIDDVYEGDVFSAVGVKNVNAMDCTENDYLECKFDQVKGEFSMRTTEKFKKYEETEFDNMIRTNLTIKCPNGPRTLEFRQRIRDTNNHAPKFSEDKYSYIFYMELPQKYRLTSLNAVTATEPDLTTEQCNFRFEDDTEELFSIRSSKEGKLCTAEITLSEAITVGFDRTFKLVADDGTTDPEHTATAEIHLKIIMKVQNASKYLLGFDDNDVPKLANGMDDEAKFEIPDQKLAQLFDLVGNPLTGNVDVKVVSNVGLCDDCETLSLPITAFWRGMEAKTKLTVVLSDAFTPPPTPSTAPSSTGSLTSEATEGSEATGGSTGTVTEGPSTDSTEVPTDGEGSESEGGQLGGFSVFMVSSLIGIMLVFTASTVVLCGFIYMIAKRFWMKRKVARSVAAEPDLPL